MKRIILFFIALGLSGCDILALTKTASAVPSDAMPFGAVPIGVDEVQEAQAVVGPVPTEVPTTTVAPAPVVVAPPAVVAPPPVIIPVFLSTIPFIQQVTPLVCEVATRYPINAPVAIAQAIIESGWGRSGLTRRANNLYGMKGRGVKMMTGEQLRSGQRYKIRASFRSYPNWHASVEDYASLIQRKSYFQDAVAAKDDPAGYVHGLVHGGSVYATSLSYEQTIMSTIEKYGLTAACK